MNTSKFWKQISALLVCCAAGMAYAKLSPPPVDPAKAEEAKLKAAEAAKKAAAELAKAQDRVAERYKKEKGGATAAKAVPEAKKK